MPKFDPPPWDRDNYSAQIIRPVRGKILVCMHFSPMNRVRMTEVNTGDGHRRQRPVWRPALMAWELNRAALKRALDYLVRATEDGLPVQYDMEFPGGSYACVASCWTASTDSWWDCICRCRRKNHATHQAPPVPTDMHSPGGEVRIQPGEREWVREAVTADGWVYEPPVIRPTYRELDHESYDYEYQAVSGDLAEILHAQYEAEYMEHCVARDEAEGERREAG